MKDAEDRALAEVECHVGDSLEIRVDGSTSAATQTSFDTLSEFLTFRASDPDRTEVCTRARYDTGSSTVYLSSLRSMSGFAEPRRVEKHILDIAGPPPVRGFPLFHKGRAELDPALEEEAAHATWYGKVAASMMSRHEDALWFHRHNTTDGVGHYYLGLLDPRAHSYDSADLDSNWAAVRRWYATVDLLLGEIVRADPDSRIAMCTDHGNVGYRRIVSLASMFAKVGLVTPSDASPRLPDRSRSKLTISSNEIFVNTGTQDHPGPVSDEEYEDVRSQAIESLRGLVDPETSSHVISVAIRREQARGMLFWGAARGDIAYFLEDGYLCPGSFMLEEVFKDIHVPGHTSEHYGCLPGYETEVGSTYSFMAFSGHPGGERPTEDLGPVHLVDFAPTVLAMFGISVPWLQGRTLGEMIGPAGTAIEAWKPHTTEMRPPQTDSRGSWASGRSRRNRDQ
jgi:hypothetical protein